MQNAQTTYFLNEFAGSNLNFIRVIEGGNNFTSQDLCQLLDSFEISVLDGHDPVGREHLLRVVVDQLARNKAINLVVDDLVHFFLHFLLFGFLDLCNL